MASITFETKLTEDGSFVIPREAIEELGLYPGDEMQIRIETPTSLSQQHLDQMELQRRMEQLFQEADSLVREPGTPLTDPLEAAWGQGVEEKARRMGLKL